MTTASIDVSAADTLASPVGEAPASPLSVGILLTGLIATAVWLGVAYATAYLPDLGDYSRSPEMAGIFAVLGLLSAGAAIAGRASTNFAPRAANLVPWLLALAVFFLAWELLTAKRAVLPQPFFPPPQALLEVYTDDWGKLGLSVLHSLRLLGIGYAIGALTGFIVGVSIGWYRVASFWIHPVLRFIGPLPAVAWLPLAFFAFPSSWSASVFLIALATGFPVAILTWSGVSAVPSAYYDVARTLGAKESFLILKVAVPAAMPSVFVGLFMGMGASFAVLVVAEMMGVKAGLGWYLQWAQGWAAYSNMYAALVVMSVMCSSLVTLLFRVRDRLLGWQRGTLRW
jgi:NitT/TauT family transport system permease protein